MLKNLSRWFMESWGLVTHDLQQDIKAHRQWAARLEAEAAEQRRQLEAQLRKNEARLQAILDTAVDGILTIDQHGIIETCNPAAAKMFGYAASELLGKNIKALMPSPQREIHDDYLSRYLLTGASKIIGRESALTGQRKDGSQFPLELTISEFHACDGRHYTGILRDISRRQEAEQALKDSERRLELALMGADLGLWDWNIQTGEVVFNDRWSTMLGYARGEIEPHYESWAKRLHPADMPRVMASLNAHLEGKTPFYETEHRLLTKSGHWQWVLARGKVFERDAAGNPLRAAGTHMDIGKRKALEERLQRQQTELLHVQRLTTAGELAATMAHELNQPLGAIANYVGGAKLRFQQLLETRPELSEMLDEILKLSQRAAEVVHGLRTLVSKRPGGREPVDLRQLLEETLCMLQTELNKRRIEVKLDLAESLPSIPGQRVHLQQLLLNLILNASEAMDHDLVATRTLSLQVRIGSEQTLLLEIGDTGVGFAPEQAERIFEPFVSTKSSGMGLGLPICRTIVENHGGKITARCWPGQGTAFTVRLPIDPRQRVRP